MRQATVAHNSDSMTSGDWTVNCEKQQYVTRQYFSKTAQEVQIPKRGTQGYAIMVNICSLPSTIALLGKLDREISWKP